MTGERFSAFLKRVENDRRLQYAILLGITLIGAAIRFYRLGEWSFWIDEIFTVNRASASYSDLPTTFRTVSSAFWTPISIISTGLTFKLLGVSEWSARLTPAIIGVLSIPILYIPMRRLFGVWAGLTFALLLALAPWHIFWSQNARFYTSLALFYTLAAVSFYYGLEKDRPVYFILFFIFLYFASSERLLALLVLPAIFLYLLIIKFLPFEKPAGLRARNILILLAPAFAIGLFSAYGQFVQGESFFLTMLQNVYEIFVGNPIETPAIQATFIAFESRIPLVVLALASGLYLLTQKSRAGLFFLLIAVVPVVIVVILVPIMFIEERYAFMTLPSWLILAALGIQALLSRSRQHEFVLAICLMAIILGDALGAELLYFRTGHGNRRDWKGAFAIVEDNIREGDAVVTTWPELGDYYLDRDVTDWLDVSRDDILASDERVWFVIIPSRTWATGTEGFYNWLIRNTRLVTIIAFRTLDETTLEIYLYDPAIHAELTPLE